MATGSARLERWAWYSVALNAGLAAAHALVALASGSLAVTAELAHNVVDLASAAAVLVGLKLATRHSERFPYGLHKVENVIAAGVAGLVFLTAYEIGRQSLSGPTTSVEVDPWMVAMVLITAITPLAFGHFELRVARAGNSPALLADAREYRVHAASTGLVLAALLATAVDLPLDRIAASLIVVVVAKVGWDLLADAMRVLLDASLDRGTMDRISRTITADPAVSEVKWVTGRNAGRFRFVEAGVAIRAPDLEAVEAAIHRIEATVQAAVPHVDRVVIQVEPPTSPHLRYAVPLADAAGGLSEHFGRAGQFAIVTVRRSDGAVESREVVANPHRDIARGKGLRVAEWLVARKVDVVVTREALYGKAPAHVLGEAGIDLIVTDATTLAEVFARRT
ncbi:MAG: cation diffusion facilitator family transporter [Acidimicrobiia bacterium]|nr:cation diffusion facilitator family transporter [Acidimicrobiia bacterium]